MRTTGLIAIVILVLGFVACQKTATVAAEKSDKAVAPDTAADLCPPLRTPDAAVVVGNETQTCKADEPVCKPVPVFVSISKDKKQCYARIEIGEIYVEANKDADDKGNEGKKRSKVDKLSWTLVADPNQDVSRFSFYDNDGIRFLKPKSGEEVRDPKKDYDEGVKRGGAFELKNRHLRKARLLYCPYVYYRRCPALC